MNLDINGWDPREMPFFGVAMTEMADFAVLIASYLSPLSKRDVR